MAPNSEQEDDEKYMQEFNSMMDKLIENKQERSAQLLMDRARMTPFGTVFNHRAEFEQATGIKITRILEMLMKRDKNQPLDDKTVEAIQKYRDYLYSDDLDAYDQTSNGFYEENS